MAWVKKINQEDHSTLNKVIDLCQWDEELKLERKDWALIDKFLALFKPIQLMSNQLSGEKYSSIHMVLPNIMDIKEYIEGLKTDKLIVKTVKTLQKEEGIRHLVPLLKYQAQDTKHIHQIILRLNTT